MKSINVITLKQYIERSVEVSDDHVRSPEDALAIINEIFDLEHEAVELFGILTLTTKNKLAGAHILGKGLLSSALVRPREVMISAFQNNAASIVLFHNHPSGDPTPSPEDVEVTRRVVDAGELIGIDIMDHIIIGDRSHHSMKANGLM